MSYSRKPVVAPTVSGLTLRALTWLLERPVLGAPVRTKLVADAGILDLRSFAVDTSNLMPPLDQAARVSDSPVQTAQELAERAARLPDRPTPTAPSANDYTRAYLAGSLSPIQVAERVSAAITQSNAADKPLRAIIAHQVDDLMTQARASAQRYADGVPLGPLDGVPVAVKDEVDQVPYPTTVGTSFLGTTPATTDATVVARLRAVGALLIGKANMHELGIGVTGLNPHHGVVRNPWDASRHTGGSSSGSAASVAAGLCPLALAADGGGSIRIPAALCGVVGLKPTFSRVSEHGAAPLCWTVGHLGPIGVTVRDAALGYAILAGPDPLDPATAGQPAPDLNAIERLDLTGVRLGVCTPWFEDATPDVVARCKDVLTVLKEAGATVHEVSMDTIDAVRLAHLVTIASEMCASQLPHDGEHRRDYGLDVRINFAVARSFGAADYAHAQRIRRAGYEEFMRVLSDVDAIITPTTGCTAPPINEAALPNGESNLVLLSEIMRFAAQANLLGLPAISLPAGLDSQGLPVGFQAMGRPWSEALLLRIAHVAEQRIALPRPPTFFDLLC